MTDPSPSQRPQVWRRLLLLFLLEWAATLGMILVVHIQPGLPFLVLILLSSALLGLVSGLGTRFLLKGLHWTLSSLAAMLALFSGLFILGMVSGSRYGLGPQEFKAFDLAGAAQVATALLASLFSATAWRKPANPNQAPASTPPPQALPAGKSSLAKSGRTLAQRKPKKAASSHSRSRATKAPTPAAAQTAQSQKSSALAPARSKAENRERRPEVQFASTQENRCPYCLEIVQPNDPRGIVECKICHTLHHADCWAITGTCQVPHLNA
jgi:hypothetical protein